AEADAGAELVEHADVRLAAVEVRLDDDADVGLPLVADAAEEVEGALGVGARLHVEADEDLLLAGPVEDPAEVLEQELLVDVLPHLRQLERDVRVERL